MNITILVTVEEMGLNSNLEVILAVHGYEDKGSLVFHSVEVNCDDRKGHRASNFVSLLVLSPQRGPFGVYFLISI